jgi:hypothetical protein
VTLDTFVWIVPYLAVGYLVLMFLDLARSPLARLPMEGRGSVSVPVFLMLAWPAAIVLYILLIPVVLVKALMYMFKGYKEWM